MTQRPDLMTKAGAFRALHQRDRAFIIPNPWDVGTARILAHVGFEALATTSAGYAFSMGQADNTIKRDEMMAHVAAIAAATDLPVSADLENGFGDSPPDVAETFRLAGATGIVGGSIEDSTVHPDQPIYDLALATDRVRVAVATVRALPFPFTLTARCENYLVGRPDLADTIKRLQAYQDAGADVLYAPGLSTREDIESVVRSVNRPVNVVMGLKGVQLTFDELSAMGVKRVSVGGSLSRTALSAFVRAARELKDQGTFTYAKDALSMRDFTEIFRGTGK